MHSSCTIRTSLKIFRTLTIVVFMFEFHLWNISKSWKHLTYVFKFHPYKIFQILKTFECLFFNIILTKYIEPWKHLWLCLNFIFRIFQILKTFEHLCLNFILNYENFNLILNYYKTSTFLSLIFVNRADNLLVQVFNLLVDLAKVLFLIWLLRLVVRILMSVIMKIDW